MTNVEKVYDFLSKAKVYYFLTTDGDQPKGRPFGFKYMDGGKLYIGCGTFKNVYKQLVANPKVEIVALADGDWIRYDGEAKVVKDAELLTRVYEANPRLKEMYEANGWELGLFYLENGHAEIRGMMDVKEEFDV